jgi:acyl-coenzyme A synthetase/AMP-(fatty) acid ligase
MASRPLVDSSALAESREVRPGNIVCVSIERSVELIVAMIAIQLAGAVYCPVHVSLPTARKAELYTQTECMLE